MNNINVEFVKELIILARQNDPSFMVKFHEYFYSFVSRLNELAITAFNCAEIEICAYTKLHFSTKEIAMYTKCSVRSVENKKYRIRKKLGLSKDVDFTLWIASISTTKQVTVEDGKI